MAQFPKIEMGQGIRANSGAWYRYVQQIGFGGNAVTYLVLCSEGEYRGVFFALKIFTRLAEARRRERFIDEVAFLRTCNHPAIMRVYDEGVFRERQGGNLLEFPFVVAEYLPIRLADVFRGKDASLTEKISYSLQLLAALGYLERLNPQVVHRDIKPQNIFIKGRSCVLGDFGLMKVLQEGAADDLDRNIFEESVGPGMPFYYPTPDLVAYVRGERPITVKSDVYQLGLVLTEMFAGRNRARVRRDKSDPVVLDPIGHIPGALSDKVKGLLEWMVTEDPRTRPQASYLIDPWHGLFQEAMPLAYQLEGRVF